MGRKSSDGSGVGTELLHALGLNKFANTTDDSETGDSKSKGQSRFGKLRFSKNLKKSKKDDLETDSGKISMEIDLKAVKDNMEPEQANEKTPVSSLVDVQNTFETILEELQRSIEDVKKNVDSAETCLESVYTSVDKLEKFAELCKVENKDVILGLHKLVNVHKGAALLSTFSSDPTFKKNCDYNVTDTDGKSAERRQESQRLANKDTESESNTANALDAQNSDGSEAKPAFVKSKSYDIKKSSISKASGVLNSESSGIKQNSMDSALLSSKSTLKSKNSMTDPSKSIKDENITSSEKVSNSEKSPKEAKISKTEKFKEKLNLRIRRKKESQDYDGDSAEAEHSSGHQTRMERFKRKFDRKSK
ncbi:hypothetical protein OIY81_2838 [Cryptosporidium canis]|uniref:Uncharacterized protein n=1 Tax=Cryptosporidium canis TaxID=195482 RepID=A0ABQ8P4N2_9CRYT|nr:hypothetical protein OIY81_2838 [Cryptosporidium canis]KAJ1608134.1 hypothetical protein OJ252_2630 [Cryptosporidium canis]